MSVSDISVLPLRKEGLTVSALDGEVLVYDPTTTRASCLNAFAAEVLERCDGSASPADIARDLPFESVDPRLVVLALSDLQKAGLLQADIGVDVTALIGANRREFFKRIGLSAAAAIPVVAGIVLPFPAQAASLGDPCVYDPLTMTDNCYGTLVCCPQTPSARNCNKPGADCRCAFQCN